jgi:serine/threonine-protein kinase RsbW
VKVRLEKVSHATLVIPEGRLDFNAAAQFQRHLEQAVAEAAAAPGVAAGAVIVDCPALDYVSSAGLRTFLQAARASQRASIAFVLSALQPAVREIFELSGFNRMIPVHADRAAALAKTRPAGSAPERCLAVRSEATQLAVLTAFLKEFWSAEALPADGALPFELALEEVFMNIVMHAAPAGAARVEVTLHLADGGVAMTIADDASPFDPLALPPPDVAAGLDERRIGGQGVHLMREMMDSVSYRREGGRNVLTLKRQVSR